MAKMIQQQGRQPTIQAHSHFYPARHIRYRPVFLVRQLTEIQPIYPPLAPKPRHHPL